MKKIPMKTTGIALAGFASLTILLQAEPEIGAPEAETPAPSETMRGESPRSKEKRAGRAGFVDAVKRVAPAVVSIKVDQEVEGFRAAEWGPGSGLGNPRGWGEKSAPPRGRIPQRSDQDGGTGSGVIVSVDGLILTNFHVVDNARSIRVELADGRDFPATVVGTDPETDLAVIEIEASGLPVVPIGDSTELEVGEAVIAIGSPYGFDRSVTSGIISALERNRPGIVARTNLIQTDAPVNPGNSGGPLVNRQGEVIGLNVAIYSPSGSNVGLGFAVPSETLTFVVDQIKRHGEVKRGYLGIELGAGDGAKGAIVGAVQPDSAGAEAGLEAGDRITAFRGKPIRSGDELRIRVGNTSPGTSVTLRVERGGKTRSIEAELAELEDPVESGRQGYDRGFGLGKKEFRQEYSEPRSWNKRW